MVVFDSTKPSTRRFRGHRSWLIERAWCECRHALLTPLLLPLIASCRSGAYAFRLRLDRHSGPAWCGDSMRDRPLRARKYRIDQGRLLRSRLAYSSEPPQAPGGDCNRAPPELARAILVRGARICGGVRARRASAASAPSCIPASARWTAAARVSRPDRQRIRQQRRMPMCVGATPVG